MLSKIIRERIEHKFGQEIRYSKDCEVLANEMSTTTTKKISVCEVAAKDNRGKGLFGETIVNGFSLKKHLNKFNNTLSNIFEIPMIAKTKGYLKLSPQINQYTSTSTSCMSTISCIILTSVSPSPSLEM
jgi:hypothetical protein